MSGEIQYSLAGLIALFEDRFGRMATNVLIIILALGAVALSLQTIYSAITPLSKWILEIAGSLGLGNLPNGAAIVQWVLIGFVLLVALWIRSRLSHHSRRLQHIESLLVPGEQKTPDLPGHVPAVAPAGPTILAPLPAETAIRQACANRYAEQFLQPGKKRLIEIRNKELGLEDIRKSARAFGELQGNVKTQLEQDFGSAVALRFWFGKPANSQLGRSVFDEAEARWVTLNDIIKEIRDGNLAFKVPQTEASPLRSTGH